MTTDVYLGIGSNVDREHNVRSCVQALRDAYGEVALSPVYQTRAVGFDGDDFLNLAALIRTGHSLADLQATLRRIEDAHGRDRSSPRFAPRTLDVDLLMFGDLSLETPQLTLPRAEILSQAFVLAPLAALAPTLKHPVSGLAMADVWADMRTSRPERLQGLHVIPLSLT